jgi:iron complex outermembrane recepter protein
LFNLRRSDFNMKPPVYAAALSGLLMSQTGAAHAQASAPPAQPANQSGAQQQDEAGHAPIIVTGRLISGDQDAIVAPVVITGEELARRMAGQIGTVLAHLPGVSTTGFAPGASRPVLRGFDGPRVQVLTDGLGSLDASAVSVDHGVAIDTLNVEQIDVLHGPAVLLYAADPAAGAVNALERRIPRRVPDQAISANAVAGYGTAADAVNLAGTLDVRLAPRLAAHFDASYNRAGDLRIGGNVLSDQLRARTLIQASALEDEGDLAGADILRSQADARGRLANSWVRGTTLGAGLAFIDSGGSLGVSVQRLTSDYGIPPRPSAESEGPVSIALRQTRYDLRTQLDLGGFLERLDFRAAYGDYTHTELVGGTPEARFFNSAIESRLVLVQARRGGWRGESGIQFGSRDFSIDGEPLVPNSLSQRIAGFTRQQLSIGKIDLEASGRLEHVDIWPTGAPRRSFGLIAGGLGIAWHPIESVALSLSATHGERAPSPEELFIDGVHEATQSYERGNPAFTVERSNTIELGVRYHDDRFAGALTAYATNFNNFIAPVPTGAIIEGVPVFQFIQADARFRGFEAEGAWKAVRWGDGSALSLEGAVDYIHARLTGVGPAPRIPPLRVRGGITFDADRFGANAEAVHSTRQNRVAANEIPVGAFTLINASLTWRPRGKEGALALILSGDNLLDEVGRLATSETRDFVPISGRNIRMTVTLKI